MNIKTEDLLTQLNNRQVSYEQYSFENKSYFLDCDVSRFWKELIEEKKLKKNDIINKADIGYTFFYYIIKGKKHPSRDMVIRILIAISADIDVFQEALRLYEWAALYPKIKRDSIIIYAINHKLTLHQTEELLEKNGERSLISI